MTPDARSVPARSTEAIAAGIRQRVFVHAIRNNGGYLSQACSSAEQLGWLYNEELTLGAPTLPMVPQPFAGVPRAGNDGYRTGAGYNGPIAADLDRLFISPAHYALVVYSVLIETGRMADEALEMFNRDGSSVEMIGAEHSPGMEVHNGSLGIGFSTAAGLAWARKRRGETGRVWVFMSDGELQEGQTWEAMQAAAFHGIDNLFAIIDVNRQQCDGAMDDVMSVGDISSKLRQFGVAAVDVDAHDVAALRAAARQPHPGRPLVIVAHSDPAKGMEPLRDRFPRLHYVRFKSEDERQKYNVSIADALGIIPVQVSA